MDNGLTPQLKKGTFPALALAAVFTIQAMPVNCAAIPKPLLNMIAQGKDMFMHNTFGGRGMTCGSCHTGGGLGPTFVPGSSMKGPSLSNAAAVFPRYKAREGRVMTLADEIHGCIQGALGGKAPAYDSKTMRALQTYITSLSQGKRMHMGDIYK